MKAKLISLFLLSFLFSLHLAAQIREVITTIEGEFEVVVAIEDKGTVTIDYEGNIVEINMPGQFSYYEERNIFTDDANFDKVSKIGNIEFAYYDDRNVFTDHINRGKIARIGRVKFTYYDKRAVFTDRYNQGKVATIDNTSFRYNDDREVFRDPYNEGKIKSIACVNFVYYDERNYQSSAQYNKGRIAKIDKHAYTYHDSRYNRYSKEQIKEGEKYFRSCAGFDIIVIDRVRPMPKPRPGR